MSGYFGKSQSSLISGLTTSNEAALLQADSSVISIRMFGFDASYRYKAVQIRTQAIYAFNKNTEAYNQFGAKSYQFRESPNHFCLSFIRTEASIRNYPNSC